MYVHISPSVCLSYLHILCLYLKCKFWLGDSGQERPDKVIPIFLITSSVRASVCIIRQKQTPPVLEEGPWQLESCLPRHFPAPWDPISSCGYCAQHYDPKAAPGIPEHSPSVVCWTDVSLHVDYKPAGTWGEHKHSKHKSSSSRALMSVAILVLLHMEKSSREGAKRVKSKRRAGEGQSRLTDDAVTQASIMNNLPVTFNGAFIL